MERFQSARDVVRDDVETIIDHNIKDLTYFCCKGDLIMNSWKMLSCDVAQITVLSII